MWYQELWNCPISSDFFQLYAEDIDAGQEACPTLTMISEIARKKKVTIVGGSIPERSGNKIYNTCCVFNKNGDMKAKFRKVLNPPVIVTHYLNCSPHSIPSKCMQEA